MADSSTPKICDLFRGIHRQGKELKMQSNGALLEGGRAFKQLEQIGAQGGAGMLQVGSGPECAHLSSRNAGQQGPTSDQPIQQWICPDGP